MTTVKHSRNSKRAQGDIRGNSQEVCGNVGKESGRNRVSLSSATSGPQRGRRSGFTILPCLLSGSWAGCLTHDVYLMVEAMARWHGWEWEHGAANTCRSGTEATPHHRRRSTPDPTNDSFDNGTPKGQRRSQVQRRDARSVPRYDILASRNN
ncbi:hypothetical protein BDP55DRAFT_650526 [Colletotrichum godetiae]|uniref:Uncharacterized protein n=1 Tax=Colletotrichum godetiae TaxID=1209918 RepID=A0AAJ0AU59_9PEZI|nr:uncharacterized protein BDP55DRAFT_650526 [Colletotrichum godetiae]KAK1690390.1 hypothetical protein BDP55DRAFT_650526 [Colletotrichum godetiae]